MFLNRALLILLVGLPVVLSSQTGVARDYKPGAVFNDIIEFRFPGTRVKVPLPPGNWKLMSISVTRTEPSNVELRTHYLIRHDRDLVTGLMRIRVPSESPQDYWAITSDCSEKRKKRAWYFHEDSYEKHEDCSVIYPFRGLRKTSKSLQKTFSYIERNGLTMPNAWFGGRFTRSDGSDYLRMALALPQEHYGFPRERKYSNTESPWNINNINTFPKKKAFMNKVKMWAKSWKGLIDRGFKNKLRRNEVRAHPKIDGTVKRMPRMGPTASKKTPAAKPPADNKLTGDEIRALIIGKTVHWSSRGNDNEGKHHYRKDGSWSGACCVPSFNFDPYGKWKIEGNKLCKIWEKGPSRLTGKPRCFSFYKTGKGYSYRSRRLVVDVIKIVEGNPDGI